MTGDDGDDDDDDDDREIVDRLVPVVRKRI